VGGFVALAAIGATVGWTLTASPKHTVASSAPPSASVLASPSLTPSASHTPSGSTPATGNPGTGPSTTFTIPAYADQKTDFQTARTQLMNQKLGVRLVFEGPQPDAAAGVVIDSKPQAGKQVARGATITLYVAGDAPELDMLTPNTGETCADFGKRVVAAGFDANLTYQPRKTGLVAAADPAFGAASTWAAKVTLTCTPDGSPPVDGPPSSSTGTDPSASSEPPDTQSSG
jgi:hypothetical protein